MPRLVKYDPVSVLGDINRLFEQTFYPLSEASDTSKVATSQWTPTVDIKEEQNRFVLLVDLPGIDKSDVQVSMENNVLTIQGERQSGTTEEQTNYYRVERVTGKFYRRFTLPETADDAKIQAKMNKGVLEVIIPKKELAKPKTIPIIGE